MLIRSAIFQFLTFMWGAVIPIAYSSVFFTKNTDKANDGALAWAKFVMFILKKFCGVTHEIRGLENLPKEGGYIIACKHQSMWETVVMHMVFHHPAYAYKKELLKVPFYGWFLKKMNGISIDRKGGAKALKDLIRDSEKYLKDGRQIILFPQGTRVPVGSSTKDYPYQPGVKALYSKLDYPIIPAALNSGKFWPKDTVRKKSGKIILEFLPAIDPKTDKKEFMPTLEDAIEGGSEKLV